MIFLFTDFGLAGPYLGQVRAVLAAAAPAVPVIDLFADLPPWQAQAAGYLLAGYAPALPAGSVFLCVVDPGVGTDRRPVAVQADGRWYVGPDNGLFAPLLRRAGRVAAWRITWTPPGLSATFHGRDLFAPVAAGLALGRPVPGEAIDAASLDRPDWPDDLARVVYIDVYGNAMTGLRAARLPAAARLVVAGRPVPAARTFGDVPPGAAFWYANANGLAEIAVNQGRAADLPGVAVGAVVEIITDTRSETFGPLRSDATQASRLMARARRRGRYGIRKVRTFRIPYE